MRAAERRTSERLAEERTREATTLRDRAGRHLLGALAEWDEVYGDEYVVLAPYAWWCHRLCECTGAGCDNWTSRRYERLRVTSVSGEPDPEGPVSQHVWITVEREAHSADRYDIPWRTLADGQRYGTAGLVFGVEWDADGEGGRDTSEEERGHEAAEVRRARRVRMGMASARAAADAAAAAEGAAAELGAEPEAGDGGESASEAARRAEEVVEEAEAEGLVSLRGDMVWIHRRRLHAHIMR